MAAETAGSAPPPFYDIPDFTAAANAVAMTELAQAGMVSLQENEAEAIPEWEAELAFEGMPTSDRRFLMPGEMDERELPLTLMAQMATAEGHDGAEVAGKITEIWREPRPELGENVVAVMARGEFSDEVAGPTAAKLVKDQVLRGVSVDIATRERVPLDPESYEEIPEDDLTLERVLSGDFLVGVKGTYMGATLVPFPAFGEASMRIIEPEPAVVASATMELEDRLFVTTYTEAGIRLVTPPVALTASAAGMAPLAPPRDWFFRPEPPHKQPLTVTEAGEVYGHLATWDQCHMGIFNSCILAKPSPSSYAFFNNGGIRTAEGEIVQVGRVIVGDGHADVYLSAHQANEFYGRTGLVAAFVRAIDGRHGIWLSGAVRSDCPAERVRDMLANPPSGDWRPKLSRGLELIAALSVPVQGFPIPYAKIGLVASAGPQGVAEFHEEDVLGMVASGYAPIEEMGLNRERIRRREILLAKAREELGL